jgi:SAM-dependent methyltransferase
VRRPFYTDFAWAYDLLIQEPVVERLAFITRIFEQHGAGSGAHVLDAGCGTGRYSVALAELGFKVTGIDAFPDQIAEARKRQDSSGTMVDFIVANICTPQPTVIVDAILCRGVLNDLIDDTSRQAVFPAFAQMLRPGGVLILDAREWNATETRKKKYPVFEKEVETDRGRLKFQSITELDHDNMMLLVSEIHRIESEDGSREAPFSFKMRCWTQKELQAYLTLAGFHSVQYFGGYDFDKPLGCSDRIVAVASNKQ